MHGGSNPPGTSNRRSNKKFDRFFVKLKLARDYQLIRCLVVPGRARNLLSRIFQNVHQFLEKAYFGVSWLEKCAHLSAEEIL